MLNRNEHVLDYVDDYFHDVLSPSDAEVVERHCENCPICRAALEEARKQFDSLTAVPPSEAPERLIQETVEKIEIRHVRRTKVWRYATRSVLVATAASVLILGGLQLYFHRLAPSPYDLRILGQNQWLSGSIASLRVAVFDRRTGQSLDNVPVELAIWNREKNESVRLATFTTGRRGGDSSQFKLPAWKDGRYELRVIARPGRADEVIMRTIELKRSWKLMLTADKPVYQPGQTIHLRSLALRRPDLKPVAGEEVVFAIIDPQGNVIFKERDVTSRFGLASADCPLAAEIFQGAYEIECRVGETTSRRTVEVQKYVLPKFNTAIQFDQPFYQPGQLVTATVEAGYFFGKPVIGGDVKIDVRGADVGSFSIATMQDRTDQSGQATFRFALPEQLVGREQDAGNARFFLVAAVTDSAGQTQAATSSRVVATAPIQLEVIPEAGSLVKDLPNMIYVYASYPDGRPAQVRLVVSGLDREVGTDELGVAAFEITPKEDRVGLTLKAADDEGRVGRRHVQFECGALTRDFLIRTDKAVYVGGDTMTLLAMGSGREPVFIDLIKDGQTMLTTSVEVEGGRGEAQLDLPPDLFGAIQLVAYRFGEAGLGVRKSRMIFVRRVDALQVKATFDSPEYRPGGKAQLRLTLTDKKGQPTPGAISLAAVDEAVFSVLNQAAGMEQAFFLIEKELLAPIYAIYDWSPHLGPSIPQSDRTRFEQALFSRTARSVAGSDVVPVGFSKGDVSVVETVSVQEFVAAPPPDAGTDAASPSPHTLAGNSFAAKLQAVTAMRVGGLHAVRIGWLVLGGGLVLLGLALFAIRLPKTFCAMAVCVTCGCCLAGLVYALAATSSISPFVYSLDGFGAPMAGVGGAEGEWADAAEVDAELSSPEDEAMATEPTSAKGGGEGSLPPRVRQWFPETLLWRPELISDDQGVASLEIDLADSITTWRLSAGAVSATGQLGGGQFPIRVFQPFFVDLDLPVALTRGDEVAAPVVVYNYLDEPQAVELQLEDADWFQRLDSGEHTSGVLKLVLGPGEVRSLRFPIKVLRAGDHHLRVTARGGGVTDAVKRSIEVRPDGRRVDKVVSGVLHQPVETELHVPSNVIDGSVRAIVKLHPSDFSQLVEGLDAILQMPYGCFEQTSSTTYPNVLALDYLRRTGKSAPAVEAKARQYIHVGYQRLVSFEVPDGGFDWFGNPPANRTLTAYGLMEFEDMARVHDVDPRLIERTRRWLLAARAPDGAWPAEVGMLDDGLAGAVNRSRNVNLAATAYIAWAVFGGGKAKERSAATLDYLLAHPAQSIDDPYLLAVAAMAIAGMDDRGGAAAPYLKRLEALKRTSDDGKLVWWEQPRGARTMFHGGGRAGAVETTAMAALALLETGQYPAASRGALLWLVQQKDERGTWRLTQATVLALKALLSGAGKPLGGEKKRQIEIVLESSDDKEPLVRKIEIPADQGDVMRQIDLSAELTDSDYRLMIRETTDTGAGCQVAFSYHVEDQGPREAADEPLSIDVVYDRQRLSLDDTVAAVATLVNNMPQTAPMVIVDLPIPGGFKIERGELDELMGSRQIARYQITARKAIIYLRSLAPGAKLELRYRLKAMMPVKVQVAPAEAYEYYDPDKRGSGGAARLEATAAA